MDKICFDKPTFEMYVFLLVCIVLFLIYINIQHPICLAKTSVQTNYDSDLFQTILQLKDQINNLKQSKEQPEKEQPKEDRENRFLNRIYNPLSGPNVDYPSGSFSSPSYDGFRNFQMIGYLSNLSGQFPVMGRYRDSHRTDKWQFYTINNDRGRIKIPFKTKNDNELYDNDTVTIQELGGEFSFKKYENIDGNRYNPDVI